MEKTTREEIKTTVEVYFTVKEISEILGKKAKLEKADVEYHYTMNMDDTSDLVGALVRKTVIKEI
jgi:hypothetical protein